MSQFLRSSNTDKERDILVVPPEKFYDFAERGVVAVENSARFLSLLSSEDGVFKRCWVVIFQSYSSCVVILHSAVQKQLHGFGRREWQEDLLELAKTCLSLLEFCGSVDRVAYKFHQKLTKLYDTVTANSVTSSASSADGRSNSTGTTQPTGRLAYLFEKPSNGDTELLDLSSTLLGMLWEPFGGVENQPHVVDIIHNYWKILPKQYEYAHLVERLDYNLESLHSSDDSQGMKSLWEYCNNIPPGQFLGALT